MISFAIESAIRDRDEKSRERILKAYRLANGIHGEQTRKNGDPYIVHPVAVAEILIGIGMEDDVICSALLHDTLEDGHPAQVRLEIHRSFGRYVLFLVSAMSKDHWTHKSIRFGNYLERLENSDSNVLFLKLADLIHNLRTLHHLPARTRRRWIGELEEKYVPLFARSYASVADPLKSRFLAMREILYEELNLYHSRHLPFEV